MVSILCFILLAQGYTYSIAHRDLLFDPVDADDYAMIKQDITDIEYQNPAGKIHNKDASILSEHRNPRKYKGGSHISFEAVFSELGTNVAIDYLKDKVYKPTIPKNYSYLFFKEINPPPPKCC